MNRIPQDELDLAEEMMQLEKEATESRKKADPDVYITKNLRAADIARYIGDQDSLYEQLQDAAWQLKLSSLTDKDGVDQDRAKSAINHYFEAGAVAEKEHEYNRALKVYWRGSKLAEQVADNVSVLEQLGWCELAEQGYDHALRVAEKSEMETREDYVSSEQESVKEKIDKLKEVGSSSFAFDFLPNTD